MFFEQVVLQRKGPLGTVWLACHYEKKLTKAQVSDTDIVDTTDKIKNPKAAMALRLSGHLLLGIVRIYCKKVDYLYTDSSEALVKIKMSFRPGVVDMEQSVVNANAITMPENFGDFELLLPGDINADLLPGAEEGLFTLNVAKAVDITMGNERYGSKSSQSSIVDLGSLSVDMGGKHGSIEQMRKGSASISGDNLSQLSQGEHLMQEDLLDASLYAGELGLAPTENEMGGDNFGMDQGDAFMANQLEDPLQPWLKDISPPMSDLTDKETSSSSERAKGVDVNKIDIPDLLLSTTTRLRAQKKSTVDKRTQLSQAVMEKTVNDPSSLLRRLSRAPPTNELIDRELKNHTDAMFIMSSNTKLTYSHNLDRTLKRGMKSRAQDIPEGTKNISSTESMRNDSNSLSINESSGHSSPSDETKKRKKRLSKTGESDIMGDLPEMTHEQFGGEYEFGNRYESIGDFGDQALYEPVQDFSSAIEGGTIFEKSKTLAIVTKRTKNMHTFMEKNFEAQESKGQDSLKFDELFSQKKRRTAAIAFFEILGLKSKGCIDVKQKSPYGDITIKKTSHFNVGMDTLDTTIQSQTV